MKPPAVRRFLRTCKLCLEDVGLGSSGFSWEGDNHSHGSMVSVVFESFLKKYIGIHNPLLWVGGRE